MAKQQLYKKLSISLVLIVITVAAFLHYNKILVPNTNNTLILTAFLVLALLLGLVTLIYLFMSLSYLFVEEIFA